MSVMFIVVLRTRLMKARNNMADNIFENLTDKEQNNLWMYMIFNQDKIKEKTEQWTKEAEEAGITLTEYLESINPLNNDD